MWLALVPSGIDGSSLLCSGETLEQRAPALQTHVSYLQTVSNSTIWDYTMCFKMHNFISVYC